MKNIILDTDFGNVYDDAGALSVLHALADRGEARILATVTDMGHTYSVGALCSINKFFGREDIPVGGVTFEEMPGKDCYAQTVVERYPARIRTGDEAEHAVPLIRRILAGREAADVTYVALGATNIMTALLKSGPDAISPMTGEELVAARIDRLVIMGGSFDPTVPRTDNPNGVAQGWTFNWSAYAPLDSHYLFQHWPGKIEILTSEAGYVIRTGKAIYNQDLPPNPIRMAYDDYAAQKDTHKTIDGAWDQLTILLAVRGYDRRWDVVSGGACVVDRQGISVWNPAVDRGHSYGIIKAEYVEDVSRQCDELMVEALYARAEKGAQYAR